MTRPTNPRPRRDRRPGGQKPDAFPCENCGIIIPMSADGTAHRNHCPHCLHSLHLDIRPGDRRSHCHGVMEPLAVCLGRDGEWQLLHRCRQCSVIRRNRIAGDDNAEALLALILRPIQQPAFPIEPRLLRDQLGLTG